MLLPAVWLCVLPDHALARPYAERLCGGRFGGAVLAAHHSGRPWIVARGTAHTVLAADRPHLRIVVVGRASGQQPALDRVLDRVVDRAAGTAGAGAAGRVMTLLDGSFHTFATSPVGTQACGDAVGLRPVFWTRPGAVTLLGDSPGVLAELAGRTEPDRVYLAARLLGWAPPSVHAHRSPYKHVALVPPGHAVHAAPTGPPRTERVWTFPDDAADLADAATRCRDALERALATCAGGGHRVVTEMSGGLDSSALSVLAHRRGIAAATLTRVPAGDGAEDARHARALAEHLTGIAHVWIDQEHEVPGAFDGMHTPLPGDEPGFALLAPDAHQAVFVQAAAHGDTLVAGHGADEVLTPPDGHLVELAARDRRLAFAHLRGYAALEGTSPAREARNILRARGPYRAWLTRWRDALLTPARIPGARYGWEPRITPSPWISRHTRELAAAAVDIGAEPLHPARHQHRTHALMMWAAADNRSLAQAAAHAGLHFALPFLDRPVLEALASVRAEQRRTPHAYKQALTEAMDGLWPDPLARRRTKSSFTLRPDLAAAAPHVAALLGDSTAARLGLVDQARLHQALARATADDAAMFRLTDLLAVELWLRRPTTDPTGRAARHRPPATAPAADPPAPTPEPGPRPRAGTPQARGRFAVGVTLLTDERDRSRAVLAYQGRTLALANPAAVAIAQALRSSQDPLAAVTARFPAADPDELARDVDSFVVRLTTLGLITAPDPTPSRAPQPPTSPPHAPEPRCR